LTSGNSTVVTGANTNDLCFAACDQARQRCQWYSFVSTAASEVCTLYSGVCTEGAANADEIVYQKMTHCYWTTPTQVYALSTCKNAIDATINGEDADNAGNAKVYVSNKAIREYRTMKLETCHQRCQEDPKCEYFALNIVSNPKVCSLFYGACTKSDADVADTNLYAKTGFYEEANL
jgi:hypothetical protein